MIRPLESNADLYACQALIQRVWSMPNGLEVLPHHILFTVPRNGGLLLGAFDGDQLVGYVFGYPGLTSEGKLKHCSHMMGIAPEYQTQGIGFLLKLAQREHLLALGFDLATWTFEPLASRSAYLNLNKLGATCRTYIPDMYGPMTDGLNAGLPSDRLQVDWWIASERVQRRLQKPPNAPPPETVFQANETCRRANGLLDPGSLHLDPDQVAAHHTCVTIEIPADYQSIKAAEPDLALKWRLATRRLLQTYFAAGFVAMDFTSALVEGERRSYYVLRAS
jgi:predicted GNAT superfamily acetyltransferase